MALMLWLDEMMMCSRSHTEDAQHHQLTHHSAAQRQETYKILFTCCCAAARVLPCCFAVTSFGACCLITQPSSTLDAASDAAAVQCCATAFPRFAIWLLLRWGAARTYTGKDTSKLSHTLCKEKIIRRRVHCMFAC
jgi:hypothetical protein